MSGGIPRTAAVLTALGVLPFAALAVLCWVLAPLTSIFAIDALIAYGAIIASFVGGIHWGFEAAPAEARPASPVRYIVSVGPSLLGWIAILLAPAIGLALLVVTFIGALAIDRWACSDRLAPAWWMRLRIPVTSAVVVCLLIALAALTFRL